MITKIQKIKLAEGFKDNSKESNTWKISERNTQKDLREQKQETKSKIKTFIIFNM